MSVAGECKGVQKTGNYKTLWTTLKPQHLCKGTLLRSVVESRTQVRSSVFGLDKSPAHTESDAMFSYVFVDSFLSAAAWNELVWTLFFFCSRLEGKVFVAVWIKRVRNNPTKQLLQILRIMLEKPNVYLKLCRKGINIDMQKEVEQHSNAGAEFR